jgi:hypothetical protein
MKLLRKGLWLLIDYTYAIELRTKWFYKYVKGKK